MNNILLFPVGLTSGHQTDGVIQKAHTIVSLYKQNKDDYNLTGF